MNSKISVYGPSGFIGSHFCRQYHDNVITIPRDQLAPESNSILYFISTVDNYNVLTDSLIDIETNLTHLMKVLNNCKDQDITFNFISSWFVYGDTYIPASEESYCNPKGFYSITKYTAEKLLESFCKTFNIKYKIIRLANVVGKADKKVSKKKNALQFLINELKQHQPIKLYNNGNFYRDYIGVDDTVKGIKFIMDNGESNEIYNLGAGQPILFKNIIDYAYKRTGSKSEVGVMEPSHFHKIVQVESMYLNTLKLQSLGFKVTKDIYQLVDELI